MPLSLPVPLDWRALGRLVTSTIITKPCVRANNIHVPRRGGEKLELLGVREASLAAQQLNPRAVDDLGDGVIINGELERGQFLLLPRAYRDSLDALHA